jgi:hypothetical protein
MDLEVLMGRRLWKGFQRLLCSVFGQILAGFLIGGTIFWLSESQENFFFIFVYIYIFLVIALNLERVITFVEEKEQENAKTVVQYVINRDQKQEKQLDQHRMLYGLIKQYRHNPSDLSITLINSTLKKIEEVDSIAVKMAIQIHEKEG